MQNIDSKPAYQRVAYGIEKENQVINCLNEHYAKAGYNLVPSTHLEDTKEKIDCWQKTKSGKLLRSAIKIRTTKNDILIALRDPFYGFNHNDTVIGRDVLVDYSMYITLSKDQKVIRVASGKKIHKISLNLLEETKEVIGESNLEDFSFKDKASARILSSKKHPKCEVWFHRDRKSWKPKLLGFIPPSILKEGKEIKYHKFIRK